MKKPIVSLAALGFLSACTSTAVLPEARIDVPDGDKIPGRYVAFVQTGGWAIEAEIVGLDCFVFSYDTDINPVYAAAMKDGLTRSFADVTFVDANLTPADLKAKGYDGQIVIMQGGATGLATVQKSFFSAKAKAGVELAGIMAVTDASGAIRQQPLRGEGSGEAGIFLCPDIGDAIGPAASAAVESIVKDTLTQSRAVLTGAQAAPSK